MQIDVVTGDRVVRLGKLTSKTILTRCDRYLALGDGGSPGTSYTFCLLTADCSYWSFAGHDMIVLLQLALLNMRL